MPFSSTTTDPVRSTDAFNDLPSHANRFIGKTALFLLLFTGAAFLFVRAKAAPKAADFEPVNTDLAYGFNVAEWKTDLVQELGFNWIKVFNPPVSKQPVGVLLRIDVGHADAPAVVAARIGKIARDHGGYIDAYEIGNEVNLDAAYGWGAAPEAAAYVAQLCAGYHEIQIYDPSAVVVSAGLAPTGRVSGSWNGHQGHNGFYQDEREYLKEMIGAGVGSCFDALGYHNYGYRAAFDASPDVNGGTPETNCTNGFCYRGVEKIYEILAGAGLGDKQVWTTEFGWIIDPAEEGAAHCTGDPSWQGRLWQMVSLQEQADNLAGAYQYAAENWPWMGGIFAFNLDFNKVGYYPQCEQMRFYGVQDRPAEAALRDMPKAYNFKTPLPVVGWSGAWAVMALPADLPQSYQQAITINNKGMAPLTYTLTVDMSAALVPALTAGDATGIVPGSGERALELSWSTGSRPAGTYTGLVTVNVEPAAPGFPLELPLTLYVVDEVFRGRLSMVSRQ